jgi:hypothetical protein
VPLSALRATAPQAIPPNTPLASPRALAPTSSPQVLRPRLPAARLPRIVPEARLAPPNQPLRLAAAAGPLVPHPLLLRPGLPLLQRVRRITFRLVSPAPAFWVLSPWHLHCKGGMVNWKGQQIIWGGKGGSGIYLKVF